MHRSGGDQRFFEFNVKSRHPVMAIVMALGKMLEFRRKSNDAQAIAQLGLFASFASGFVGAAYLAQARPVVAILLIIPAAVSCFAVTQLGLALLFPFEYICQFHTDRVQWWTTRDSSSVTSVPVPAIRLLEVDFDDLGVSWDAGSVLAQGIRSDIDWDKRKLQQILDFVAAEWKTARIFVIEAGVRRELSPD